MPWPEDPPSEPILTMKVLHVPQAYWPVHGGGEVLARAVSEGLADLGNDVRVFVANVPGVFAYGDRSYPGVDAPRREKLGGVRVERFPHLYREGSLSWRLFEKWRALETWPIPFRGQVRRWYRRRRHNAFPDAVLKTIRRHTSMAVLTMSHFNPNVMAVADARAQRTFPLVYSPQVHDTQPGWRRPFVRRVVRVADVVTANTPYEAELLAAEYGADPDYVVVTGCGVPGVAEVAPWPRPRRVLYVGRKTMDKGLDLLIDAMRVVWASAPDVELVLAGARTPHTKVVDDYLAALPTAYRERVQDLDNISEEKKDELLRESACLVLASKYESFGIVLLEAWRHGTPVVSLDHPVSRDIVRDEESGLLPGEDPEAFAHAILRLVEDQALAERLGRAGHADVQAHHTWERVSRRYHRALRLAVAG